MAWVIKYILTSHYDDMVGQLSTNFRCQPDDKQNQQTQQIYDLLIKLKL